MPTNEAEAERIAVGEYPLGHDLCTCTQYPKMRCRLCRDRNALREEVLESLAAAEARGRQQEREACAAAQCPPCGDGHPLHGEYHRIPREIILDSEPALPYVTRKCSALAIRARTEQEADHE